MSVTSVGGPNFYPYILQHSFQVVFHKMLEFIRLIGNAIFVTAFLSYCGPFNQEFRQRMLNEWQKQIQQRLIPFSENFYIIEQLNDEATVSEWNLHGLPNDDLSIQNGIIATSNYRYPLLIDP